MRLAWLTDIHLDFVSEDAVDALCRSIDQTLADGVLLGGDIGQAPTVEAWLTRLARRIERPIHFVLGNHDYYNGSIREVRQAVSSLARRNSQLHYLPDSGTLRLTDTTALVGHGGWADGRLGNFLGSTFELNDYVYIRDLSGLDKRTLQRKLMDLGDEAAGCIRKDLDAALKWASEVILLTHVPPFKGASWHRGRVSDDNSLPHFSCAAVGDVLMEIMRARPDRSLTVLCGHTHSGGEYEPLPNLRVLTGGARYGNPVIQRTIVVS